MKTQGLIMVTIFGKPTMHQELCIYFPTRSLLCLGKMEHNCPILQFLEKTSGALSLEPS